LALSWNLPTSKNSEEDRVKGVSSKLGIQRRGISVSRNGTGRKEIMQDVIDNVHQQFIKAVVEGRKLEPAMSSRWLMAVFLLEKGA